MAGYSSTHSGAPRPEICTAPFQAPSFAEHPWSLARACYPYAVCKQLIYTRFSAARLRENRYFPDAWSIASSMTDVTVCRGWWRESSWTESTNFVRRDATECRRYVEVINLNENYEFLAKDRKER
ncbi:hypothetical protein K0M31_010292 [Melipona bicolor]|uniref:Uncharacterized protein n=1 Tax=Melipona bicolor TaxID=60889 RepID=A0AA40FMC4_9HYME|nr:hypothetical protein K0M31_010292 [Melipona bicolor]